MTGKHTTMSTRTMLRQLAVLRPTTRRVLARRPAWRSYATEKKESGPTVRRPMPSNDNDAIVIIQRERGKDAAGNTIVGQ